MISFHNRTVVITGGATGIGFGLAKAFGREGAHIVIAEPREDRLREAVDALKDQTVSADYFVCDVSDLNQVEALADFAWSLGHSVAAVVNNAGVGIGGRDAIDADVKDVRRLFDVNFFGVWHGCSVFGKRFSEQAEPAGIYNVGSENALYIAAPNAVAYAASKHAVLGMTEALREELPEHVSIGLICPGFVRSELIPPSVAHLAMDTDEYASIVLKQIKAGEFFIVSHAYNMVGLGKRYAEISQAYEAYAPRYEGDENYDVRVLLAKLAQARDA